MLGAPTFDLQSHSVLSDGELGAADVVRLAADAGVELLALSDHDTVDGVGQALEAAAVVGLRVVPAVELSAVDAGMEDLHVLGYLIDHTDPSFLGLLETYRGDRQRRIDAMAQRMLELGFEFDDSELEHRRRQGKPVGRPHIAKAVLAHPANAKRLAAAGVTDMATLFPLYLVPGAVAYVPRQRPTVGEAIEVIHGVGGVAVWAHPFWDVADAHQVLDMIARFRAMGLDGVEAFYPTHSRDQATLLCGHCRSSGLLSTGSADFHGPGHATFARFRAFDLYGETPELGPIGA